MTIFGKIQKKPAFVDELMIEWCIEFKLLGIYFYSALSNMQGNYEKAIDSYIEAHKIYPSSQSTLQMIEQLSILLQKESI